MESTVETKKPLSERLEQLITNLKTNQGKPELRGRVNPHQPFSQEGCVICGLPRLDGDPTGLTCGLPKCLSELGVRFKEKLREESIIEELTEKLTEITTSLSMKKEEVPADTEEICIAIGKKINDAIDSLSTVAEYLGLEMNKLPEDLIGLCEAIETQISQSGVDTLVEPTSIVEKLTEIANQLGLNPKMLSKELDGLLKAIAEEISTIKSTVEELIGT